MKDDFIFNESFEVDLIMFDYLRFRFAGAMFHRSEISKVDWKTHYFIKCDHYGFYQDIKFILSHRELFNLEDYKAESGFGKISYLDLTGKRRML